MFKKVNLFIEPKYDFEINSNDFYLKDWRTYTELNYLRPGFRSNLQRGHLEKALDLTKNYFGKANVIDFGCADGCFLPSLSRYFNKVVGVDIRPTFIKICNSLIEEMDLKNVDVFCNKDINIHDLNSKIKIEDGFDFIFLLEVLEHVGDKNNLYPSKMKFLNELFSLIKEDGSIIISVPNTVGINILLNRYHFIMMGNGKMSFKELLNGIFFNNTDELEKRWDGGHLGFNNKKFQYYMEKEKKFQIVYIKKMMYSTMYIISKREVIPQNKF